MSSEISVKFVDLNLKMDYVDINPKNNALPLNKSADNSAKQSVKVLFNNELLLSVDRQKVLKCSKYFSSMLKDCYADKKTGHVKINFPVKVEIFELVLNFIDTGFTDVEVEDVFDLYQIAVYLQMTGLELFCIVRFTRHLNRTNVETYLKAFRTSRNIVDGLANAALQFKQSGRPSYSGVYFLE